MSKIAPCLWFDGVSELAARHYVAVVPDSRIDRIVHAPADNPSTAEGAVLLVEFTLAGQGFVALNGGPGNPHTDAISFQIYTDDQTETDRIWAAMIADGFGGAQTRMWLPVRIGWRFLATTSSSHSGGAFVITEVPSPLPI
ncbi:MAG: VOC family protein, partial [Blastomonas fulva]